MSAVPASPFFGSGVPGNAVPGGDSHAGELVLVRHGATEWSEAKRHTGRTDLPMTEVGRAEATALRARLSAWDFRLVLVSPLERARETARLAGLDARAEIDPDLCEWDYGDYEGLTTAQIREDHPGWTVWSGDVPNGETAELVGERADRVITRVLQARGPVALVAHAHLLRILTARWLELGPREGARLALGTGTLSVLGFERETRVILAWNVPGPAGADQR